MTRSVRYDDGAGAERRAARRDGRRRARRDVRRGRRPARRRLPHHRRADRRRSARTAASTPRSPRPASSASPSGWRWAASGPSSRCSSTRSRTRRSSRSPRTSRRCATVPAAGSTLPMVIRIPYAGGIGGVEHHCDSSEAYYAHTPGLKVVTPATAEDAYTLLREAIDDPDPVIFMEPKKLYWSQGGGRRCPARAPAVRPRRRPPGGHATRR